MLSFLSSAHVVRLELKQTRAVKTDCRGSHPSFLSLEGRTVTVFLEPFKGDPAGPLQLDNQHYRCSRPVPHGTRLLGTELTPLSTKQACDPSALQWKPPACWAQACSLQGPPPPPNRFLPDEEGLG